MNAYGRCFSRTVAALSPESIKLPSVMKWFFRAILWLSLLSVLALGGLVMFAYHWVHQPLKLPADKVDIVVPPGAGPSRVAKLLVERGVDVLPQAFVLLARVSERDRSIKAGGYEIRQGDSLWDVLERMARGEFSHRQIAFIEGWTLRQIIDAVSKHPDIQQTIPAELLKDPVGLAQHLEVEQPHLEGLIFPDTYVFAVGTPADEILKQALGAQQDVLQTAWAARSPDLPLNSPYEALILASIVEKETGRADERARIAGVFVNRLRVGMPLQTDPTVIYGMGELYQGRIRKADLRRDTPWNTYTRSGLPPTPIASSSRASLHAALHPEKHGYFYFVARGDGSSEFAKNLTDHNRNVAKFILGKP